MLLEGKRLSLLRSEVCASDAVQFGVELCNASYIACIFNMVLGVVSKRNVRTDSWSGEVKPNPISITLNSKDLPWLDENARRPLWSLALALALSLSSRVEERVCSLHFLFLKRFHFWSGFRSSAPPASCFQKDETDPRSEKKKKKPAAERPPSHGGKCTKIRTLTHAAWKTGITRESWPLCDHRRLYIFDHFL